MPAQPQTNTRDLLQQIIDLDHARRELSEFEIRALRNQIEAVRKHSPDEGAVLSAALAFFVGDVDAGVAAVRVAYRTSSSPQMLRVCAQSVTRAGRIIDALEFSKEMVNRFPGSAELQSAEVKIAFGAGQMSRVAAGMRRLEAMGATNEEYDPMSTMAILGERGHTEDELTAAISAARSFIASKSLRVRGWIYVASEATSGVDSHLHYAYNAGLNVDESLDLESGLIDHLLDLDLPIYADGTVVMSITTVDLGEASAHDG